MKIFINFVLFRVCIIAADISPIDVLSHLPILCEENNVAYIYVKSRAEVGEVKNINKITYMNLGLQNKKTYIMCVYINT